MTSQNGGFGAEMSLVVDFINQKERQKALTHARYAAACNRLLVFCTNPLKDKQC